MRRKSTRNSTKTPDKPKQAEPASKKGRRSSRRHRKSTTSESDKSEDEHEVQMDVSQGEEAQTESDRDDSPERKTRGGKKRKSEVEAADEKVSRRSKRRGSPDGANEEGATSKGKSKGKNKSKVDKGDHATEYQSETCKESEISENAQVTPQSPETVIDKPVCESAVVVTERTADDNGDVKPDIDENDKDSATKDNDDDDRADVENQPAEPVENNATDDLKTQTKAIPENSQIEKENTNEQCSTAEDKPNDMEIKNVEEQESEKDSDNKSNEQPITESEPADEQPKLSEEIEKIEGAQGIKEAPKKVVEELKPESEIVEPEQPEENSNEKTKEEQADSNSDEDVPMQETTQEEKESEDEEKSKTNEENASPKNQNGVPEDNEEKDRSLQENTEDVAQRSFDDSKSSIEEKQDFEENEKSNKKPSLPAKEDTRTEPILERKRREPSRKLPERQNSQKIKLNRQNSESSDSGSRNRRLWGGGLKLFIAPADIDSTLVKTVFPKAQILEESEVKLESEPKIRKLSIAESMDGKRDRRVSMESHGYDRQTSDDSTRNESVDMEPDNSNIIAFNRKISIIDDSVKHLKPPPSPAKNPPSDVLFITNLVRPFTLKHLRELLERTGKIKETGFWTDRIKSKCYIQYESEEEAKATREALHGVNWPSGNSKKLIIDYGTAEEMEKARNPPQPVVEVSKSDKENEEEQKKKSERAKIREEKETVKEKREHVREWDVGKEDLHRPKSRGHEHSEKRRHSRRSSSPADDYSSKKRKKVEDQVPQKLMDDLFQKTKATPSIYWQPLTPEEIATKQQQRLERMAEHKKMLAETSRGSGGGGGRSDFMRGAPYRRKYD